MKCLVYCYCTCVTAYIIGTLAGIQRTAWPPTHSTKDKPIDKKCSTHKERNIPEYRVHCQGPMRNTDTTAPTLAEVTAVTTSTNDTTPAYTFSSTEAGTITYGGSCTSSTTSVSSGNNVVNFSTFSEGTYSNCTITVTDATENVTVPQKANPRSTN